VVSLPTDGHTPGHQSLRLRFDGSEVVLAADACYFGQTLRERRLSRNMYDREAMLASLDRLEALERGGARAMISYSQGRRPTAATHGEHSPMFIVPAVTGRASARRGLQPIVPCINADNPVRPL
jgi:glyoxylase-like metal-dependent hydrolase (beta-lactamase superfamily II)